MSTIVVRDVDPELKKSVVARARSESLALPEVLKLLMALYADRVVSVRADEREG